MNSKLKFTCFFLALFFLIHEIIIISDGLVDDEPLKATVAVILGSKVNKDGSLSSRLKARLDKGLALYNEDKVEALYVSGGLGIEGFYEGTVMKDYLVLNGVNSALIKVDDFGMNTRNTALNFVRDYPAGTSAILVTQYFHITRCKLAFKQVGVDQVQGAHCNFYEGRDLISLIREFLGFYKYLIFY